ncbi:hypothetical protein ACIPVB_02370 [Microbacterium sp. NPDC090007]|uniref:hypothetical protein n=1 Tax=Microbacterium sp. NPDC090007 TaxID=3364204 RepID=UPI00380D0B9F
MPGKDPDFADIYGVGVHVVPDAHDTPRRNVVVHPRIDVVTVLGRTKQTQSYSEEDCVLSARDDSCRLDLPGMFSTRFQHSIFRAHFANENDCEFYGTLSESETMNLRRFWDRMLGF